MKPGQRIDWWQQPPDPATGTRCPWGFQRLPKTSQRYMPNHTGLNLLDVSQRFPRGE